ncbi:glycosyltransferase family 2 protein [Boseongicola aestuarii]|uniref:N-acetylglucosaminyl-diphospho-decaprenol L-rhamnosyltransferase n=1 Tax=Boseongicola aestuarii TaxID=1470561 RepID=A0A238J1R1_9RHOB|nr:glycosyltransferase family 2 protein [Boseongicola aestuarii]SMX24263.1 N-acetylglucosaminyl-diphospho-decaprenol L-rhamnosyltransferase [Boseongicola aestuarii]
MNTSDLSIVVISHNTRDMTLACLKSVYAETKTPFELIVVDNDSQDGSADAIAKDFPDVTLISEKINHGFAPAHSIALRHASAPWLLLLNPDTVVLDSALDKLFAHAQATPEAGIWGGRTLFADGTLNPSSCWGKMTPLSLIARLFFLTNLFPKSEILNSEEIGRWPRDTARSVDIVTGCLFLIRRKDWDRLNGFDPAFKMYGEEADLCLRAQENGFRPRITPTAEIIHHGGASDTIRAEKMVRLMRAKMEIVKRHFSLLGRPIGLICLALWPLSRGIVWSILAVLGYPGAKQKAQIWMEIWRRRSEWKFGYNR